MPAHLVSERVLLRPFHPEEADALFEYRLAHSVPQLMRTTRAGIGRRVARSGRFVDGRLDLAIESQGRLVGSIDARRPAQALPPGTFEIGIELFEEADRGHGLGTVAVELLVGYLFEALRAARVQAGTATWNTPMQRLLRRLGFVEEGLMRAYMPADGGGRDDYLLFGITRAEWSARRASS